MVVLTDFQSLDDWQSNPLSNVVFGRVCLSVSLSLYLPTFSHLVIVNKLLSHCQQTSLFLPPPNRTEQGKRSDLHQALDHLKEGMSMTALIEQMPGTVSRAYKMLGDYQQEIRPRTAKEQVLADCDDVEWRVWQQEIIDLTKTQPDGRTIHWYLESEGNTGKTFLRRYLQATASLPLFLPTFSTLYDHP